MKLLARTDSEENRKYWTFVEKVADEVKQWPEWKKAGIGILCETKPQEENSAAAKITQES